VNALPATLARSLGALAVLVLVPIAPAQGVADDVAALLRQKDDADQVLVTRIAASKSRAGAEGLIRAFDLCSSILMRRHIVQALGNFDGSGEAEQPALGKVASIAATGEVEELRAAAIAALAASPNLGRHFLRQLVDSKASDLVREPALREHVRGAAAGDASWYRRIWNLEQEQRKDAGGNIESPELPTIRLLAFTGLAPFLAEAELVEAMRRDLEPKIRRHALGVLRERDLPKTAEMAQWMLERVDLPGADRLFAARILADRLGPKVLPTFLELARKREVTPEDLRRGMAEILDDMNDESVQKKARQLVGKGKPHEHVFALLAAAGTLDARKLGKELASKDLDVRRAAADIVARRQLRELLPELHEMLAKGRNPGDRQLAITAISAIERGADAWLTRLAELAADADRDVRNAAVEQIGAGRQKQQIDVLGKALDHADWSTRCVAIDALAAMRHKSVVPLLIARLPQDPGRLARRIADVLWQLTAQPFGEDAVAWASWWQHAAPTFELASDTELAKAAAARERKRLTERTKAPAKFFGLEITSHRVVFVIDVSGSMIEAMYGRTYQGRPAARIDVARQEVVAAIANLASSALFNVYAFSNGVEKWKAESAGTNDEASRKAAITWVERLGANGGTNISDALAAAFADQDVDTIYLLSDGEPSAGITDPHRIRAQVAFWNAHRKITIHTVAVGSSLEILEWLAADSGGRHIKLR
jgi:hypothetical protein